MMSQCQAHLLPDRQMYFVKGFYFSKKYVIYFEKYQIFKMEQIDFFNIYWAL